MLVGYLERLRLTTEELDPQAVTGGRNFCP